MMVLEDDNHHSHENQHPNELQNRLSKVQTAIHKATQEARKQQLGARSSTSRTTSSNVDFDVNSTTGSDQANNVSFLLGMDLFGQDTNTLERGIRDKLDDVEEELQRVLKLEFEAGGSTTTTTTGTSEEDQPMELDPAELSLQIQVYQRKVSFLRQASLTRSALDEAALTSTNEPDLSHASDQLVQATVHHQQAQAVLLEDQPMGEQEEELLILKGLQHAIRRQRVELLHKASSVLDASIHVGGGGLANDNNDNGKYELAVKNSHQQLEEAYHVLETLEGGPLALEETMRKLTRRLYDQALSPLLHPFRQGAGEASRLTPWKVTEKEDQPTKRIIGVSTSTTKGVVHRMEWHRRQEEEQDHIGAPRDDDNKMQQQLLEWPVEVWKDTFTVLLQILVFVQSRILLGRPRLCQLVGTRLFGKPSALPSKLHLTALGLDSTLLGDDDQGLLMEELVHLMAKTCLPDDALDPVSNILDTRGKELLSVCLPFCQDLAKRLLLLPEQMVQAPVPADDSSSNKLVKFCQEFQHNYVEHRRCILLNQARDILRNHDYHNTISIGVADDEQEDPTMAIFLLHKSSISEVAFQLMALLRQTMTESVTMPATNTTNALPPTLRPTLYKTAREMLSLFRAIIPATHGREVATVPRTAAVLHNDCIFFAHHCLTLGLEFKEKYSDNNDDPRGKLLKQSCIFVDMVPLFRELADQSLGDMLDVQADQLVEIVGSRITNLGPALQSNTSKHEWSEAETALAAGIYHLRHLAQSWRPILSKRIFAQSMGHLADVILTLYWKQVTPESGYLASNNNNNNVLRVSPNAKHFLLGLYRKAFEDLKDIFAHQQQHHQPTKQSQRYTIDDCSSEWGRFQALIQFLDMGNLGQVQAALANGVFRLIEGHELAQWIEAVYYDDDGENDERSTSTSQERRTLLQSLSSTTTTGV